MFLRGNVVASVTWISHEERMPTDDTIIKRLSRPARRLDGRIHDALQDTPLLEVGTPVPVIYSPHIPSGETGIEYSTLPPTSGPHWERHANCGIYDNELTDEQITHNLEHGHIVISHNLQDHEQIEQLKVVARGLPDRGQWLVLRPYSKIPIGEVAMTTWGWIQPFDGVDEAGIREFYLAHYGRVGTFAPC